MLACTVLNRSWIFPNAIIWVWKVIIILVVLTVIKILYRRWWSVRVIVVCLYFNITIIRFIGYELIIVVFVWWVIMRAGYERGSAVIYLGFYSFVLRWLLIANMDMMLASSLLILIGYSKLPVFRLHQWLPKVHVEATMVGSIVLARVVLKAGSIFCCWYCEEKLVLLVRVMICGFIILSADGKVVVAYSSIAHISLCVVWFGIVTMYNRWSHVVVSPLMFLIIYVGYINSGSRIIDSSFKSNLLGMLLVWNVGFPLIRRFYSELLVLSVVNRIFVWFVGRYFIMGVVSMNMYQKIKGVEWMPWHRVAWTVIVMI